MSITRSTAAVLALGLVVSAAAAGCNGGASPPPGEQQRSALTREAPAALSSPDVLEASRGNRAFALELFGSLRRPGRNAFFSPYSITSALAMTYAGASGETAAAMAHALHYTLPAARLHPALNAIDQSITQDAAHPAQGSAITWRTANALFAQRGRVFLPTYLDTLAASYGAGVSMLDFAADSARARTLINGWVADQTEGHIAELLPAGSITGDTRFVLTNAVYFHAAWEHTFETGATRDAAFHRADGTDVTVRMMNQREQLRAAFAEDYVAVEVPYANRAMTMLAVMPTAGTLDAFEAGLTDARLAEVDAGLHASGVALSLPRFTMRSSFSLREALGAMGMAPAFAAAADFSAMDGTRELRLSDVVHQAWVDVSESGTEAAAATGVIGIAASAEVNRPVVFDRPFVFVIRDNPSGTILFAGRVNDPSASM